MLNVKKVLNKITRQAEFKTLLWTNANPTSNFAAQTISLDLSGYDAVDVVAVASRASGRMAWCRLLFNAPVSQSLYAFGNDATKHGRDITTIDSTGITFDSGFYMYMTSGSSKTTDNGQCIPYKIYGVKLPQ